MEKSLSQLLRSAPSSAAVEDTSARLDAAALLERSSSLAQGLHEVGIVAGDRVALMLDHAIDRVIALFAIAHVGAVSVPINRRLRALQISHIVRDCGVRVLIGDAVTLREVTPLLDELSTVQIVIEQSRDDALTCAPEGAAIARGWFDFDQLSAVASGDAVPRTVDGESLATILYTSGSTGAPKGVMLSHASLCDGAEIGAQHLKLSADDRVLGFIELSNVAGLHQLLTTLAGGSTLVLRTYNPFDDFALLLATCRITGMNVTPTQIAALLARADDFKKPEVRPRLRYMACGGGALRPAMRDEILKLLPTDEMFLMYGLTEAVRCAATTPEIAGARIGCIGEAVGTTTIEIVDDDLEPVPRGSTGEILVRGPTVAMGYWQRPAETAKMFVDTPRGRALRTGDLGRVDDDGQLICLGRRDLVIKSAGYRISPTEIEAVLASSDAVAAAAVIGVPDDLLGEAIHAYIVPASAGLEPSTLIRRCRAALPAYMVPVNIVAVPDLPMTVAGKVDYAALRARGTQSPAPASGKKST
jgi:amino acid adenylation domain-containing protein